MSIIRKCLTIAGSDCSGGAGIQADLKAFAAHGCYGASVITTVVAENTCRVNSLFNVPAEEVEKQIDSVFEDIEIDAVKLGLLPSADIIRAVAGRLRRYRPPFVVCDPVLVATSGDALSDSGVVSEFAEYIFPLADVITPNIPEAEAFSGVKISSLDDFDTAAAKIISLGAKNLLIKGGHFANETLRVDDCVDVLYMPQGDNVTFCEKRVDSPNTHGTGCTLSSAIAAQLARGKSLPDAVEAAKRYVAEAIAESTAIGKGHSPVNHFYNAKFDIL